MKEKKNRINFYIVVLIVVFFLSVLIRLPWLNRNLTEQDSLTASVLRYWRIWDMKSIVKYKFNPVTTFPENFLGRDKNLDYSHNQDSLKDKNNNYYYTSYPPFSYIFPYLVLKILHLPRGLVSLRLFSMFFHLVSALFIFFILKLLIKKDIYSLIAAIVYLFTPITLWYQGFVYMADMMVQSLWIIEIYLVSFYFIKSKKDNIPLLFLIGIINFLSIYTEWLAIFFAFIIFVYSLFKIKKEKFYFIFSIVIVLSTLFSLSLIVFQYSQISGFKNFIHHATQKYLSRSGTGGLAGFTPFRLVIHYGKGFLPQFIILFILFIKYIVNPVSPKAHGKNFITMYTKQEKFVLLLALLPVLFHHIVFFQFTIVHDFSVLKSAVFISLLIGILLNKSINWKEIYLKKKYILLFTFGLLFIGLSLFIFIRFFVKYDTPMDYKTIGEKIYSLSDKNQIIFLIDKDAWKPEQQLSYYTKRNFVVIDNTTDAYNWLKKAKQTKGIIFLIENYKLQLLGELDLSKKIYYFKHNDFSRK